MPCIDRRQRLGAALLAGLTILALLSFLTACGSRPAASSRNATDPAASHSWAQFRVQAALRMMLANPAQIYTGAVPDPLLAIPVLEIELRADGSVRSIEVLRVPTQAKDTVQIAIDAVHRAAPFGDVSRLPKPWKFSETFLFNDERKFKPRTLDP